MNRKNIFILLFFILAVIAYHLFGYIGHYGYDDLHYAELAVDITRGIFDPDDHFSYRTPVLFLTALSYSLLGVSDSVSAVPSLLVTIAIIVIIYSLLKKKGSYAVITGLALTVFSNWFLFYSDKIMPDLYVALSIMLSLYLIHRYKFESNTKNPFIYSALLGLSVLFGFMAKGTVVLFIPVLFFFVLTDFLLKRDRRFWIWSLITGVVIFFTYFLVTGIITGGVFKRFEAIVNNSYLNLCSYEKQPLMVLLKRIVYQFFSLLVNHSMATGFLFLTAWLLGKKSLEFLKMNDSFSFWTTSAFILLLSSNFMTISLTSYSPMCLDPRHFLFLIPVVSISASTVIKEFVHRKAYKFQIILIITGVTIISFFLEGDSFKYHYLPVLIVLFIYLFIKPGQFSRNLFLILFVAAMMLMPLTMVNYAQKVNYRKQKDIFEAYVISRPDSFTVITNEVQTRLGSYYNEFKDNERINFVSYKEFKNDTRDNRKKILFMNWYTSYLSGLGYGDLPYYARHISEKNKLIYRDEEMNIEIYEMNDILIPEQSFAMLMHSRNTFEKEMAYWNQNNNDITTAVKYSGNKSNKLGEFSSSFEYELDSLDLDSFNQLSVNCSLYCYFPDKTNAKLVVSIENQEGAYIWHGLEINKFIKAYSNWWPVQHEVILNTEAIKRDSRLKVYVWNMEGEKAFVDNFEVKITGY